METNVLHLCSFCAVKRQNPLQIHLENVFISISLIPFLQLCAVPPLAESIILNGYKIPKPFPLTLALSHQSGFKCVRARLCPPVLDGSFEWWGSTGMV